MKALAVQGTLRFKVMTGGAGETTGTWQRLSEERKSKFVMKFGDNKWWGEQFVFDGDKSIVRDGQFGSPVERHSEASSQATTTSSKKAC